MSVDMDIGEGICCEDFWERLADCIDNAVEEIKNKAKEIIFIGLSLAVGLPCGILFELLS